MIRQGDLKSSLKPVGYTRNPQPPGLSQKAVTPLLESPSRLALPGGAIRSGLTERPLSRKAARMVWSDVRRTRDGHFP